MSNQILSNYISAESLAEQIGVTPRTLFRWQQKRVGPPVTQIGRKNFYKISSVEDWLKQNEGLPPR